MYFSVLEPGKFNIKVPAGSVSGEGLLPVSYTALFLLLTPHGRRGQGSLWGLLYNSTNPAYEDSTLVTEPLPKSPTSKYPHAGDVST